MQIFCPPIPNLPYEERPLDCADPIWRCTRNPIIGRHGTPTSNSIFNSAVVPYKDGFAGVFRVDDRRRYMQLHRGFSDNGIDWKIDPEPIRFQSEDPETGTLVQGYDPRVVWVEDRWYIIWCNCVNGPTIGIGWTFEFEEFHQLPNAFPPYNRNGVLFPRKIDGRYFLLHRPSDNGHTAFGDIYCSESPDLTYWGKHRLVMKPTEGWQSAKIGAGPAPIETSEGWLIFYHGVLISCNGYVYSFGAALLDRENPWRVIARSKSYLLAPNELYECVGDVPNVTFPCAALCDGATGRLAIYYGCADTCVGLAFSSVDRVLAMLR